MNYSNQNKTPINQEQFRQIVPNLSENFLEQLVKQAKSQGISEKDIEDGLKFIKNLK